MLLMQSDLTAHEGSDPIASCMINRSNYCEIARLARAASFVKHPETDRVLQEEKIITSRRSSNELLVANFREQPSIEAHSCRMIHDAIESQQTSLGDSFTVADKFSEIVRSKLTLIYFAYLRDISA